METTRTPITPTRQAFVEIAGHRVLAFVLPGGQIVAAFRMICNILGVSHQRQIRRVQADSTISDYLLLVKVEIVGTPQEMNVIVAEAIPMWLANIHESRVSPAARETLAEFQRVAVQTLRAFFFPETKAQPQSAPPKQEPAQALPPKEEPTHSAPPKQEPEVGPPPAEEDEMAYWEEMSGGIIGLEKQIRAFVAFQKRTEALMVEIKRHLNEHAKGLNQHAEVLRRHETWIGYLGEQLNALTALVNRVMTPGSLTAEHQGEIRAMLRGAAHQAGQPIGAIERELAAAFGVETISQLPETRWGEIAAWFHQRLGW